MCIQTNPVVAKQTDAAGDQRSCFFFQLIDRTNSAIPTTTNEDGKHPTDAFRLSRLCIHIGFDKNTLECTARV